jgi:hypothetical protein
MTILRAPDNPFNKGIIAGKTTSQVTPRRTGKKAAKSMTAPVVLCRDRRQL